MATPSDIAATGWRARFERMAAHPVYDAAMRVPATAWALGLLIHEIFLAKSFVATQFDHTNPEFLLALASRISVMLLLGLQAMLYISRRRPVARAVGWYPRIVAVLGATFSLALLLLDRPPTSAWLNLVSTLLILAGSYLSLLVMAKLGRSLSILPEGRRLVTDGPYRWVRHPLYVTEEISILGVFLQFRDLEALAILAVQLLLQFLRMREEERVLMQAFPEYAEYSGRTARLIPGVY